MSNHPSLTQPQLPTMVSAPVPLRACSARPASRASSYCSDGSGAGSRKRQRPRSGNSRHGTDALLPAAPELHRRLSDLSGTISLGSASSSEVASSYKRALAEESAHPRPQQALARSVNIRSRKVAQVIPRSELLHYDNAMDKLKGRVTSWLKKLGLKRRGPVPLPLRARRSSGDEEHRRALDPRRYKRRGKFVTLENGQKAFEVWYELRAPKA